MPVATTESKKTLESPDQLGVRLHLEELNHAELLQLIRNGDLYLMEDRFKDLGTDHSSLALCYNGQRYNLSQISLLDGSVIASYRHLLDQHLVRTE